ncbi:MAG: 5'-phosphate synthase pdxT subunit [Verrucomicrobiales bacterium]
MTIGVLALQGAFRAHADKLTELGVDVIEVRLPGHLDEVDALIMPGGESTTMSMLLESSGLFDPLARRIADGMAVFGTCAGLILLAEEIEDGRPDQRSFSRFDITVQRNGYGRQIESFETQLETTVTDDPVHAVFIRAPRIIRLGPDVEVLATERDDAVLIRTGDAMGAAFHPELANDARIHRLFLDSIAY